MSTKYTFEELAAAAASSFSTAEVVRKLGLEPSRGRKRYVLGLLHANGIDCTHFRVSSQLYTKQMLEEAATASNSISEVVRRIGAKEVGGTKAYIGRRLRQLGIDISHFESLQRRRRVMDDIPVADFASAVAQARSIAEVSRILGVSDNTQFRRIYRARVLAQQLDTSHMKGQAHARGTKSSRRSGPQQLLTVAPGADRRLPARRLRSAMIEIGMPYRCAFCKTGPEWQGHEITLEVDHISGDIADNRPQNLRFLCPNCHATTPTYCRKKKPGAGLGRPE